MRAAGGVGDIELAQLRRVPRSVARGPGKTEAIRAAIVGGWINCLITDTYTAERLLATGSAGDVMDAFEEENVAQPTGAEVA